MTAMLRPRSFDEVETVGFVGNRRWMDDDAKARMADRVQSPDVQESNCPLRPLFLSPRSEEKTDPNQTDPIQGGFLKLSSSICLKCQS